MSPSIPCEIAALDNGSLIMRVHHGQVTSKHVYTLLYSNKLIVLRLSIERHFQRISTVDDKGIRLYSRVTIYCREKSIQGRWWGDKQAGRGMTQDTWHIIFEGGRIVRNPMNWI
jgi:hypothetical protein